MDRLVKIPATNATAAKRATGFLIHQGPVVLSKRLLSERILPQDGAFSIYTASSSTVVLSARISGVYSHSKERREASIVKEMVYSRERYDNVPPKVIANREKDQDTWSSTKRATSRTRLTVHFNLGEL